MRRSDQTIFALSSGRPPSAIAVVRMSGPQAGDALQLLAGKMPSPRTAARVLLRDAVGEPIDDAVGRGIAAHARTLVTRGPAVNAAAARCADRSSPCDAEENSRAGNDRRRAPKRLRGGIAPGTDLKQPGRLAVTRGQKCSARAPGCRILERAEHAPWFMAKA